MNPLVKEYLNKRRGEILVELGLYEKVYADENEDLTDFPEYETDEKTGNYKYYKKVPIEVSDEEFAEILKYPREVKKEKENTVALILSALACLTFAVCFIYGIVMGSTTGGYSFLAFIKVALLYWASGLASGIVLLGLAEIIKLLNDIKNK